MPTVTVRNCLVSADQHFSPDEGDRGRYGGAAFPQYKTNIYTECENIDL